MDLSTGVGSAMWGLTMEVRFTWRTFLLANGLKVLESHVNISCSLSPSGGHHLDPGRQSATQAARAAMLRMKSRLVTATPSRTPAKKGKGSSKC